jgi:glycosyltransferase involved in cell wall biosynthesis
MHFVWIGHGSDDYLMQLHVEISRMGISNNCHFVGEQQDPYPFFAAADIFLLPSREDPYPVVMIEAALFSLPIVCFDQAGGASEFINEQLGVSVPYLDVALFAKATVELAFNPAMKTPTDASSLIKILDEHMLSNVEPKLSKVLLNSIG